MPIDALIPAHIGTYALPGLVVRPLISPVMCYLKRRISSRARTDCRFSRAVRPASERFRMVVRCGLMSSRRAVERWLTVGLSGVVRL
jgi:hypothetical protein